MGCEPPNKARRGRNDIVKLVEAALFSAGHPLKVGEIASIISSDVPLVRKALNELMKDYSDRDTALGVIRAGGKYALTLRSEYADMVAPITKTDIPRELVKTAALIAYHQPVKQSELQDLIGTKVYAHVRELKDLGLIRARPSGKTLELRTTKRFLEYFGIDAKSTEEIRKYLAEKAGIGV